MTHRYTYSAREMWWNSIMLRFEHLVHPERRRVKGCMSTGCKGRNEPHLNCVGCGAKACRRSKWIDPANLQRRLAPMCQDCERGGISGQGYLDEARTKRDWKMGTDPVDGSALRIGLLPEQIPSHVRRAIRAFQHSEAKTAVVEGTTAGTLNQSLASLGLDRQLYAETRGGKAVLRRAS